jgi:hypothetical protein
MDVTRISATEDAIITALQATGLFQEIVSAGREGMVPPHRKPSASVVFLGDSDVGGNGQRSLDDELFGVIVSAVNKRGEKEAARTAYVLIEGTKLALRGKTLGLSDIEPLRYVKGRLVGYSAGDIDYQLDFSARRIGAVQVPD